MPRVPSPVTSTPEVPGQPYDATAPGTGDAQSDAERVYASAGGKGSPDPWPKIQDGGAADMATGRVTGDWPSDGTSDGRAWKQC